MNFIDLISLKIEVNKMVSSNLKILKDLNKNLWVQNIIEDNF